MNEFTIMIASLMSVVALSIDAMLPALGVIGNDLAVVNPNHTQFIIGFIFLGMTLGQLVCGPLSDAIGRKRILYYALSIYFVGSVICFFAPSLKVMLVGRFLQGIGVSGPYVAAVAIVRDKFSGRDMAKVMSLVMMIFILVPAIAPALGQGLMMVFSWRAIFVLYIVYAAAVLTWITFRLEETLPVSHRIPFNLVNMKHGLFEIVRNRRTVCYTICMGICFGSFIGYLNSSQQIFQVMFGTGKMFIVYFGCLALLFGLASLTNSRFVQKLGMRHICIRSVLGVVAASALFLIVNLTMPVQLWMFMCYVAVMFFCFGLMFGNLNSLAMEPMGHIAGIASAIIGASSSAISMSLGALIGQMYNDTLIPMTVGFLSLGLLSLKLMYFAERGRQ